MEVEWDGVATDWPIVTVRFVTRNGDIWVMATANLEDRILSLDGLHIHGASANAIGIAALRSLARYTMEMADVDEIVIKGAVRTSGANPGRVPGTLRFFRDSPP